MMELVGKKTFVGKHSIIWLVVCVLAVVAAFGENGGDYELVRSEIAAGGMSSGGPYVLTGTIGQAAASVMSGGGYELTGGFLAGWPVCIVDFRHFARFADNWLETDCNDLNAWCEGADLDQLGDVDGVDLRLFVNEWLCWCPYGWPLK